MNAVLLFLAVIAGISLWWLAQQRLLSKPWLEEGALGEFPHTGASTLPAAKIGLGIFLAVVGCLFALLISAYMMRVGPAALDLADRVTPQAARLLWLNTGMLVLSSAALQWAWWEAGRGGADAVRSNLLVAAASALAFVAGQLLAWRQLAQAGYTLTANPASSFFYLLTGVHGLHILGGLVALGRVIAGALRGAALVILRRRIELSAIYWHSLLLVWLILFGLLMGWANDFADFCRALNV